MALKFALPTVDKRQIALAKERFKAWWDGAEFDETIALEKVEAEGTDAVETDLFEPDQVSDDPRLVALQRVWGESRIFPKDDTMAEGAPARVSLSAGGALAVYGPGLWAPVAALSLSHPGQIRVFEWREETQKSLKVALAKAKLDARVSISEIDAETFTAPSESFDALVAFDAFTYADNAARLAMQFARMLKPKANALIETYCAEDAAAVAPAFASAFSEPHLRSVSSIASALDEAGLRIESAEDVTEAHLAAAQSGFRALAQALKENAALPPQAAQELVWETQSWRARFACLRDRRIERRAFLAVRAG